jgi:hypothetical protein
LGRDEKPKKELEENQKRRVGQSEMEDPKKEGKENDTKEVKAVKEKIVYFEKQGVDYTKKTLKLAKERTLARKIKHVVLASTRGYTAQEALKIFKDTDVHLVAIPHQYGSLEGELFDEGIRKKFEQAGHDVYISTMLFGTYRFWEGGSAPATLTNALYRFSKGMKVCVEIALMAANAGIVPIGEDIITIAGTDIGADTAVVIRSSTSINFDALQVREVICKPFFSYPVPGDRKAKYIKRVRKMAQKEPDWYQY